MEKLEDKRRQQRSLCYLNVIEEETGNHIGHVGDIHHEGLNLVSEDELSLHNNLSICEETLEEEIKISLVIKGVWNQMNEEPIITKQVARSLTRHLRLSMLYTNLSRH